MILRFQKTKESGLWYLLATGMYRQDVPKVERLQNAPWGGHQGVGRSVSSNHDHGHHPSIWEVGHDVGLHMALRKPAS
jgi:hypothetical protein